LQDRHELLLRLEHLHSRIRNKKSPEKEEVCELLELFEIVVFDVYEELERLNASRCGLLQKAACAKDPANPSTEK
jgi:hypothetical protein